MAERRAQQKYLPPDYDPARHGSLNSYHGQHHLRERAKKLDQGILVIRFELPFNIYCDSCNNHFAKGHRYNAEKMDVGQYLSTKIWQFSMKCDVCKGLIVIKTDPQNADYEIVSGARRKIGDLARFQSDDVEDQVIEILSGDRRRRMAEDPIYRAEQLQIDKTLALSRSRQIESLLSLQDRHRDNLAQSQLLRSENRVRAISVPCCLEAVLTEGCLSVCSLRVFKEEAQVGRDSSCRSREQRSLILDRGRQRRGLPSRRCSGSVQQVSSVKGA